MSFSRRSFLYLSCSAWGMQLLGQVATRGPEAGSSSCTVGSSFDAYFVDVAPSAGLTFPTIYGGVDHKEYILEADGCGCAFIDYDNDGWMDVFVLSGTRLDGAPAEHHKSALQE